ncbi:polysaccharide lyase family 1 protein [Haloferax sp. DFSO60]|uniref:pectate lyase family protein n=1 Tax=Haloferax sp. DFSO60 TaxID=3388652 RepID=UPI00397CF5F1
MLGCLAGCTQTASDEPTPPTEVTTERTETETSTPSTSTETTTPHDDRKVELSSEVFASSPSSAHAPTDGYASADWLDSTPLEVVKVTNLDNYDEGSLRWAVERTEPRLIVFEVGGVIDLAGFNLRINEENGNVVIAGQTAPDPGITLIRDSFDVINAQNVIIQHLRVRPGTETVSSEDEWGNEGYAVDAMNVGGSDGQEVIVDHCSMTWGSDEVLSTSGRNSTASNPFTIANTIIAEGQANTQVHPEDEHAYGSLISGGHDTSIIGNLYANNHYRNPYVGRWVGIDAQVVNNLIFNCGGGVVADINGRNRLSIIGNKATTPEPIEFGLGTYGEHEDEVYLDDNQGPRESMPVTGADIESVTLADEPPIPLGSLTPIPAADVEAHHTQSVGARPAARTPHDERILTQLAERDGAFIDTFEDVGGYPDLAETTRKLNVPSDSDALGDWLSQHTKAVELPAESPPS